MESVLGVTDAYSRPEWIDHGVIIHVRLRILECVFVSRIYRPLPQIESVTECSMALDYCREEG